MGNRISLAINQWHLKEPYFQKERLTTWLLKDKI